MWVIWFTCGCAWTSTCQAVTVAPVTAPHAPAPSGPAPTNSVLMFPWIVRATAGMGRNKGGRPLSRPYACVSNSAAVVVPLPVPGAGVVRERPRGGAGVGRGPQGVAGGGCESVWRAYIPVVGNFRQANRRTWGGRGRERVGVPGRERRKPHPGGAIGAPGYGDARTFAGGAQIVPTDPNTPESSKSRAAPPPMPPPVDAAEGAAGAGTPGG